MTARNGHSASGTAGALSPVEGRAGREGARVQEMQRRRMLLAAGELLAQGGVEAATAGAVCRRAAVSRRTFYELFEDREACLLAAFDEAVERVAEWLTVACAPQTRWSARTYAGVAAFVQYLDAHPGDARLCVVESLRGGPLLLERRRRALTALAAQIDEGRRESRLASGPFPLAAEAALGGALAVIHARLVERDPRPLAELAGPLAAMILQAYLGPAAARRELERPAPRREEAPPSPRQDPFKGISIRFTYRTARVLATIGEHPGSSNRLIADSSGISDDGQISRLLRRLQGAGLVENRGIGHIRGEANAWRLTERGEAIHDALAGGERVC